MNGGCTDPHFLNLGNSFRWVASFISRPLYPPSTHCVWDWVGPRADLDDMESIQFLTLPGLELRTLGHPARCQSLYRLRYRGYPTRERERHFNSKRLYHFIRSCVVYYVNVNSHYATARNTFNVQDKCSDALPDPVPNLTEWTTWRTLTGSNGDSVEPSQQR
jgi:hypothetical protein